MNEELFPDDSDQLDPQKVLENMQDPAVQARWEGSLRDMVEIVEAKLAAEMKPDTSVAELARHVVFAICSTMGGGLIYFPRGDALKRALRDAVIYKDWSVNNVPIHELVGKYKLANQTVYDIIRRQRALHRKNEPDLFGYDEGTMH
ncbi:Mor transcription activator family protein [Pseudomonas extremaustralis]|uniref:Transcriptional regulator n=1 Tax=Pseudomonas extremaustralis TaxID=359110 RepID=A0A5C5QCV4_9PSED|nr:Mor transcription activator family protein [Pseudomonas extremaustralis]EZI28409.1 transcriptional regulator [Pseudomonas extremaustralis 14-3 substr. 14-3b]TWS03163.1 transcriptional regulator [Pseudomonas extremaustralis]SDE87556.1 Transcriptional regulator, Middle operon regulator (Mor) family [Pseudomonas extremaustralis]